MSAAQDFDADVIVVGAGPVGLTISNTLGQYGVKVLLLEKGEELIDYPRAVGMDDECLRSIQGIGLAGTVQQHLTPYHWMRFVTASGRCFASIEPRTDDFGWSRRNAFNQPAVDRELMDGLKRFANVEVWMGAELEKFDQDATGVSLTVQHKGKVNALRCKYLVASDGGRSFIRTTLGIGFGGFTDTSKWLVVDIRNDPLGVPNIYMHSDPQRPYVSVALPDGVRRFEFMIFEDETEEQVTTPERMAELLAKVLPAHVDISRLDFIRKRVYTHNARIAERWKIGRIMLAGDAAHIMPVWQGQGYNTGMRDATNLAWKLAYVVNGKGSDALLETYQSERPLHAKAMIDLSVTAGNVLAPPKRWHGAVRDGVSWLLNYLPPVKRYFLEMRFKPMPQYHAGALVREGDAKTSPVGKMFIQPKVTLESGEVTLLDNVIGPNFAVIGWGCNPLWGMSEAQIQQWQALGTRFIQVVPDTQIHTDQDNHDGVTRIGDTQNRLRAWFAQHNAALVVMRPDRFVAAIAIPQTLGSTLNKLASVMTLTRATADIPVEKVA